MKIYYAFLFGFKQFIIINAFFNEFKIFFIFLILIKIIYIFFKNLLLKNYNKIILIKIFIIFIYFYLFLNLKFFHLKTSMKKILNF